MSGVVVPGTFQGVRSLKDKTARVTIDLQELDPNQYQKLFSYINSFVKVYISDDNISQDEIDIIDTEEIDNQSKSPSQRQRNVLFRLWEQDNRGYEDFNLFYNFMMNQIIEHYKGKLL